MIGNPEDTLSSCLPAEHDNYAYVAIAEPYSGQIIQSPFVLKGCSRTFESNVVYQLVTHDRQMLIMQFTMGGGVDGSEEYEAVLEFEITEPTLAYLRVYEANPADLSELKFIVPMNRITLLLMPPDEK